MGREQGEEREGRSQRASAPSTTSGVQDWQRGKREGERAERLTTAATEVVTGTTPSSTRDRELVTEQRRGKGEGREGRERDGDGKEEERRRRRWRTAQLHSELRGTVLQTQALAIRRRKGSSEKPHREQYGKSAEGRQETRETQGASSEDAKAVKREAMWEAAGDAEGGGR